MKVKIEGENIRERVGGFFYSAYKGRKLSDLRRGSYGLFEIGYGCKDLSSSLLYLKDKIE